MELRRGLLTVQLMVCIICRSTFPQYVYCNTYIAPMCQLRMHFHNYEENICVMYWKSSINLSLSFWNQLYTVTNIWFQPWYIFVNPRYFLKSFLSRSEFLLSKKNMKSKYQQKHVIRSLVTLYHRTLKWCKLRRPGYHIEWCTGNGQ